MLVFCDYDLGIFFLLLQSIVLCVSVVKLCFYVHVCLSVYISCIILSTFLLMFPFSCLLCDRSTSVPFLSAVSPHGVHLRLITCLYILCVPFVSLQVRPWLFTNEPAVFPCVVLCMTCAWFPQYLPFAHCLTTACFV